MKHRLILVALVVIASVHAQDGPPQAPTFRTGANYVRVDVYPTLNGVPVADLRQDDFEVLDNGTPQKIDQFERVQIRAAGPQETRREPNTVAESRAMLEEPRARVFVIFLDLYHVETGGSHDIRAPIVKALDSMIGPDDLVGVMTPDMSAADVAFARKTTTIEGMLTRYWYWGERDRLNPVDAKDQDYYACYPGSGKDPRCGDDDTGVADEMVQRRHERMTLDALGDLVRFLRGVREERKAILAITDGWLLYGPDPTLARRLYCEVPGAPPVNVDPRGGKLTMKAPPGPVTSSQHDCDSDRIALSQIDDRTDFRRLLDAANRANASFYPVDPRGLVAFDTPIMSLSPAGGPPPPMVPPSVDAKMLQARLTSLRTLADATDGLAIVGSNDLAGGVQRVVDDLTSYYLLGYYTTAPLDGRFHSISVRVKRPGVKVRARRGYLALTPAEAARAAAPPSTAEMKAAAEAHAFERVVAPLEGYSRDLPLRLQTIATGTKVWVDGELGSSEARNAWRNGGTVDVLLTSASGETVGSGRATIAAGARTFEAAIAAPGPGEYDVRVRARPEAPDSAPINEVTKATVSATPAGVRFVRHGPGNRETPAADLRFRRSETVRVEWPAAGADAAGGAHLLDRTGKPLPLPVAVAARESDGIRWLTAQVTLAPLAPGDYIVELQEGTNRRMAAFRVVP